MELDRFEQALAVAIAARLDALADTHAVRVLRSVALDVHPWHGRIGLAVLTDEDPPYGSKIEQREEMAAWRVFELATSPAATPESAWPSVDELGRAMRAAYSQDRASAQAYLEAAARALDDARVTAVLRRFATSPDFERFVGHPDDSSCTNLCAGG